MSLVSHCKVIQLWIPKCLKPFTAPLIYTALLYCLPCCPYIYNAISRYPYWLQHSQQEPLLYRAEIICRLSTIYMYLPTIALELLIHVPCYITLTECGAIQLIPFQACLPSHTFWRLILKISFHPLFLIQVYPIGLV
jgi:hypothetical protein